MAIGISPQTTGFNAGQVAANGSLQAYQSGTTTPVTLYQDAALTIPVSNPVTLDVNGCAYFYIGSAYNLKYQIYSAAGSLLQTIDPVYPFTAIPGGGADLSAYTVKATGATTARVLANYFGEAANVKNFGATGNGSTDDTAAVQAAASSLGVTGGMVFFPPGYYNISSTINSVITQGNVKYQGYGNSSILYQNTHNVDFINIAGGNAEIDDLQFQAAAYGSTPHYAIVASGSGIIINKVLGTNISSGINFSGVTLTGSHITLQGLKPASGSGMQITNPAATVLLDKLIFGNAAGNNAFAGIYVTGCASLQIVNSQLFKMGTCLYLNPAASTAVNQIWCTNAFFDTSTCGVFAQATASGSSINGLKLTQCWNNGHSTSGVRLNGTVNGTTIMGGTASSNSVSGITLETTGVAGTSIQGAAIQGNTGNGIQVAAAVSYFQIQNNTINSNGSYGVIVAAGASNEYIVAFNQVNSNTTGSVSDGGTGGNKIVSNNLT
jgi:hypothetical protein